MKKLYGIILLLVLPGLVRQAGACTSFALQSRSRIYVAKNLDWNIASGYLFINEQNERKTLVRSQELCWRAKYRSLTFNQLGKGFPLGGMNEMGLVVEELNMAPFPYFPDSTKIPMNEFQLVQYLLDNCSTVDAVKESLDRIQLAPLFQSLHYFMADCQGKMLVAEFDGQKFIYHDPSETGFPILSNNRYQESLRYLKNFQGFGGDQPIQHRQGSNERFVSVASMLSGYRGQGPVDYAFGMLDTVSQADTRWSLVYDPEKLEVHFIAKALGARKVFRLGELLTRESVWGLGGNLLDDKLGKVQALGPVSSEENADLLREVFQQISYQTGERIDYPLLYEMAMQGDQHLPQWVDGELKRELNQAIRQLPGLSPLLFPDSVFDGLADWSSYDIVGLGEATHGTKEFCQFKHRMFKYLVENHGYRVLAYEYSFRNSLSINIYVLHGEGDIDSILSGESWIQNNEEVKELIRWMRSYNAGRAYGERIQFIGIDTQVDAIRLPEVLSYLEKNHFGFCDTHRALMAEIKQLKSIDYHEISPGEYESRKALFLQLESAARTYREDDRTLIELVARSLINSHEFLYGIFILHENPRDRHLADNVLCICKRLAGEQKVAVWAHNAHVANNPDYYGPGEGSMGKYLRDSLEEKYLSLATSFSLGSFKAVMIDPSGRDTEPLNCSIAAEPPGISTNFLLHSAKYDAFSLGLKLESGSALDAYMQQKRPLVGIGDCYLGTPEQHFSDDRIIRLAEAHDLLFYFRDTHPVTLNHEKVR